MAIRSQGVECLLCHGTGRLVCDACQGAGARSSWVGGEAPVACPHCDGKRVVACVRCEGSGRIGAMAVSALLAWG